jgi:hypothetical protein
LSPNTNTRDVLVPMVLMQEVTLSRVDPVPTSVVTGVTLERPLTSVPSLLSTPQGALLLDSSGGLIDIDLPYSNFAYEQFGTPWPVNQAVYVDAYLYDYRGYHDISAEEISIQFRNN